MIDFPANPTVNQIFTAGKEQWIWDGTKWLAYGVGSGYVPIGGGTMTGPLILNADATIALGAATKEQVDARGAGDNRIINGDMRIDQRNNGASGTAFSYTVDRWSYGGTQPSKLSWGRLASSMPGFPYCLGFGSTSAYTLLVSDYFQIYQSIEADMVSDFQWGNANAQPVTLSFWVSSSLTGIFSGVISNSTGNRSYPFTYNIPTANTNTRIVVTIPGDTGGPWVMSGNAAGVLVHFDLGSGANYHGPANAWSSSNLVGATGSVSIVSTNGAAFYVTGVKLEIGSVATPYNRQSLAKSLADCQRYYQVIGGPTGTVLPFNGLTTSNGGGYFVGSLGTTMRATPTYNLSGTLNVIGTASAAIGSFNYSGAQSTPSTVFWTFTVAGGLTAGQAQMLQAASAAVVSLSAEL
jgi:hypothetical protein